MVGQIFENNIINVMKKFDPSNREILSDVHLIAGNQQFKDNEIFEAGMSGYLYKIFKVQTSDSRVEEKSTHFKRGYLFITNNQLRFFSLSGGSTFGKFTEIDTNYSWEFYEISYSGIETERGLFGGGEKWIRFRTPLGELKFSNSEAHLENFGNILKDKTTRKTVAQKSNSNFIDELERLAKLKSEGVLSNEEFELAKSKLLR